MASTTTNFKLTKPSYDEVADIGVINANMDKLDKIIYSCNTRNLLVNSYFRKPVNQQGFSTMPSTSGTMCLDRWEFSVQEGGSITLTADGLVCNNANLIQKTEPGIIDSAKTYTMALWFADGTHRIVSTWVESDHYGNGSGIGRVVFYNFTGTIVAAALYEGSYTDDTLPPYVPKGYATELAECQMYYRSFYNPVIPCANNPAGTQVYGYLPIVMRSGAIPSITINTLYFFYGGGNFVSVNSATAAANRSGIRIAFDLSSSVISNLNGAVSGYVVTLISNL